MRHPIVHFLRICDAGESSLVKVWKNLCSTRQVKLQAKGMQVNHKRVYRVYREAGLLIRRKRRKRLVRAGFGRSAVTGANQEGALDFVDDAAESGREFRVLVVIDGYTRECLAVEGDTGFSGRR